MRTKTTLMALPILASWNSVETMLSTVRRYVCRSSLE